MLRINELIDGELVVLITVLNCLLLNLHFLFVSMKISGGQNEFVQLLAINATQYLRISNDE